MARLNRRQITGSAPPAGIATAASYNRVVGANERGRLRFIRLGNPGAQVLRAVPQPKGQEVVAIGDIWEPYLEFAAKKIGTDPKKYHDYRQILDRNDVDAVTINTPDHWHALQTVQACQAKKDVYVEKPLSLAVAEGRK